MLSNITSLLIDGDSPKGRRGQFLVYSHHDRGSEFTNNIGVLSVLVGAGSQGGSPQSPNQWWIGGA